MIRFFSAFVFLFIFSTALFFRPASAETKNLYGLFAAVKGPIDGSQVYPRNSPEYGAFMHCQTTSDKNTNCSSTGDGYFFDLSATPNTTDSFDLLNRCIAVSFGKRVLKGPVKLTTTTVECDAGPEEVVVSHLAVCYQRKNGTFCTYATACFAGAKASGQCVRDYIGEEIFVARNANY